MTATETGACPLADSLVWMPQALYKSSDSRYHSCEAPGSSTVTLVTLESPVVSMATADCERT